MQATHIHATLRRAKAIGCHAEVSNVLITAKHPRLPTVQLLGGQVPLVLDAGRQACGHYDETKLFCRGLLLKQVPGPSIYTDSAVTTAAAAAAVMQPVGLQ